MTSILNTLNIKEFLKLSPGPQTEVRIKIVTYDNYDDFTEIVDEAIAYAVTDISRNPEIYHKANEDAITAAIVSILRALGLNATHDTMNGGHCDIMICGKQQHQWLGEAKISTNYPWVKKGFMQLTTRYASGDSQSTHSGLLVYHFRNDALKFMDKLRAEISELHDDIAIIDCHKYLNSYIIKHMHHTTQLELTTRCTPVFLHFDPKDK